jgi:hypothetical protein
MKVQWQVRKFSGRSDGIDELRQMLADARKSAAKWQEFLECFVDDEEVVARQDIFTTVTIGRLHCNGELFAR